jgi:uncharacterized protein (DUF1786 family)
MKILAIDIGAGTEDILLVDRFCEADGEELERCLKMVIPSPSSVFADNALKLGKEKDWFFFGSQIGGGRFSSVVKDHIKDGYTVCMTEEVAYTIRNDLDEVSEIGVNIVSGRPKNFRGLEMELDEVDLPPFFPLFQFDPEDIDVIGIAVQDHGVCQKGRSNRRLRLEKMKEMLSKDRELKSLAFVGDDLPPYYLRMRSAYGKVKQQFPHAKSFYMDTAVAAILGCLEDERVKECERVMAINVGNGHTMAAIVIDGRVNAIFEHHTRMLDPKRLESYIVRFGDGELSDDEVFTDNGHGVFYLGEDVGFSDIDIIAVTGPNRKMIEDTRIDHYFASPGGDMMMTGPAGLIAAIKKFNL